MDKKNEEEMGEGAIYMRDVLGSCCSSGPKKYEIKIDETSTIKQDKIKGTLYASNM